MSVLFNKLYPEAADPAAEEMEFSPGSAHATRQTASDPAPKNGGSLPEEPDLTHNPLLRRSPRPIGGASLVSRIKRLFP